MSAGEELLAKHMDFMGIAYEREVRFAPPRRWRLDFQIEPSLPIKRAPLGVEVDGGSWSGGHRRGTQADGECDKLNELALSGWTVLHFTPAMVDSGAAVLTIQRALGSA